MEEGGLAGLERGQNEKKRREEEEAVEMLSHFHRECVITASLTQTSLQMRRQ